MFFRVKGTQDLLDVSLFNFIIDTTKKQLSAYHFTEIIVPVLESVALFNRSLGETTDVVTKEMFVIASGEHDQDALCLRPEATASIVRAFVENNVTQAPWKVFTWGPMFRYERPQKGRYRQFNQVSMEIIGSQSVLQDAQFIKMLDRLFHEGFVLADYALLINYLGCPADRVAYQATLKNFLDSAPQGTLCDLCLKRKEKNILRVFDCKNSACQHFYQTAPHISDALCSTCTQEWQQLQDILELLSVSFVHKPSLVRGLDYYTKTVFEFVSGSLGAQSAFCAGGRYDQLVREVGGKADQPSIGAALGVERLMLLLEPIKATLALPQPKSLHVIVPMGLEQQCVALLLADELQGHGLTTEVLLEGDSMKSMMRHANKLGAQYCLIIGSDEQQAKEVMIKNMITSHEQKISQSDVVDFLKK